MPDLALTKKSDEWNKKWDGLWRTVKPGYNEPSSSHRTFVIPNTIDDNTCSSRQLAIMTAPCIYLFCLLLFAHKNMANYALAEDGHGDNTRGKKSIKIPLATKDVYKYCPENYAAYIYNKLPERYKNNTYSIF